MKELIRHAPETMTSKQRVQKTFNMEKTDRVPIDVFLNPGICDRLQKAFGLAPDDYEGLLEAFGADFYTSWPAYRGPLLYPERPDRQVDPVYGFYTRWIAHEGGGYQDFCDFPLKDADSETIAAFPVPSADDFDYDTSVEFFKAHPDRALYAGNAGIGDIINSIGRVMSMEGTLVNLFCEDEATLALVDRKVEMELGILDRLLSRCRGLIDFVWIGEDLGTQIGPMISLPMYRKVLRPRHQRFIDLAKSYGLPTMVHTCGSSSWAYEDFIEMGVRAVDTLQPEAANMSPAWLKSHFGGRLAFHGCISTAGVLSFGTPQQVREEVRSTLATMMPGGGYMLAPTHLIQDNTPVENVLAMYQAAHDFGCY